MPSKLFAVTADLSLDVLRGAIDARLEQLLPSATEPLTNLHAAMRYAALAPGKRLRPALAILSSVACGGTIENALDAGCAIEMVHAFSLIHDDLPAIDNDDLRRGRPTLHRQFTEATAILAGDALFALAFQTLCRTHAPAVTAMACVNSLCIAVGSEGLVGGEFVDVESEGKPTDGETLSFIHSRKTGALIASACEIGALLGGGSVSEVVALRRYGEAIGLAFQIADDVLNETGTEAELGKAAGSDRARQKATYPALYGIEKSKQMMAALVEEAILCLKDLPGPTDELSDLANFVVQRRS